MRNTISGSTRTSRLDVPSNQTLHHKKYCSSTLIILPGTRGATQSIADIQQTALRLVVDATISILLCAMACARCINFALY
jgi:hypothetical protein